MAGYSTAKYAVIFPIVQGEHNPFNPTKQQNLAFFALLFKALWIKLQINPKRFELTP